MSLLSVIVPCYNEEENVLPFYEELMKNKSFFEENDIEIEVLYIDDGSRDGTVAEVKKLREKDKRVHLVSFPEILARKQLCTQGWKSQRVIMLS